MLDIRNYMALSIRRAAAWLYLRRIADWIAQKLYCELMNKTVLGLWPLKALQWSHVNQPDSSTNKCPFFRIYIKIDDPLFCDRSVIKLQNTAKKRCIITLMSLAIKGIRDSAMRRNNRIGGSDGLGYERWSCAIRRT